MQCKIHLKANLWKYYDNQVTTGSSGTYILNLETTYSVYLYIETVFLVFSLINELNKNLPFYSKPPLTC